MNDLYEIILGRSLDSSGAHAWQQGMNARAIGVCLVGNFDLAPPPEGQLVVAAKLVRWLLKLISRDASAVIGHRDVAPKTCPGTMFDMAAFRGRL